MSGWDAYIETQLMSYGVFSQAAILGKDDVQVYAQEGGFQIPEPYTTEVTKEDGTTGSATIDEASSLRAMFADASGKTKPPNGFRMNGVKYQIMREQLDPRMLVLKCNTGGATVAVTNTLVIVGIYTGAGHEGSAKQLTSNDAVEKLADYLRSSGY